VFAVPKLLRCCDGEPAKMMAPRSRQRPTPRRHCDITFLIVDACLGGVFDTHRRYCRVEMMRRYPKQSRSYALSHLKIDLVYQPKARLHEEEGCAPRDIRDGCATVLHGRNLLYASSSLLDDARHLKARKVNRSADPCRVCGVLRVSGSVIATSYRASILRCPMPASAHAIGEDSGCRV